jgi:hypothetical protein
LKCKVADDENVNEICRVNQRRFDDLQIKVCLLSVNKDSKKRSELNWLNEYLKESERERRRMDADEGTSRIEGKSAVREKENRPSVLDDVMRLVHTRTSTRFHLECKCLSKQGAREREREHKQKGKEERMDSDAPPMTMKTP